MKTCAYLLAINIWVGMGAVAAGQDPGRADSDPQFRAFLQRPLQQKLATKEDITAFYTHAFNYWREDREDYQIHPERYRALMELYRADQKLYPIAALREWNLERFRADIDRFKRLDAQNTVPAHPVLFIGSSSIVHWDTASAFACYPVVNRGFGGSTITEVNHYFDQIVRPYSPAVIVLYAGDNDLDMPGSNPQSVLQQFHEFADRVASVLPHTTILYLSLKPTLMDPFETGLTENVAAVNRLIRQLTASRRDILFVDVASPMYREGKLRTDIWLPDAIHLNEAGYSIWNEVLQGYLSRLYDHSGGCPIDPPAATQGVAESAPRAMRESADAAISSAPIQPRALAPGSRSGT